MLMSENANLEKGYVYFLRNFVYYNILSGNMVKITLRVKFAQATVV